MTVDERRDSGIRVKFSTVVLRPILLSFRCTLGFINHILDTLITSCI